MASDTAGTPLLVTQGPRPEVARWIVDIADATSAELCGGKARGLARLQRAGFAVPTAICLTTSFYRRWLQASGVAATLASFLADMPTARGTARHEVLASMRTRAETAMLPDDRGM
jgi:phosphoenolpyruvate synthase/pyruvate phosphate dikinase